MPNWASAPTRSRAPISAAVRTPPAAVTLQSPAARTTGSTRAASSPLSVPSISTNVTRNPPTKARSSSMRSSTPLPVGLTQPSTTTSPSRASSAAMTRSRGSCESTSGVAAVPMITLAAPSWSHRCAVATSRIPPPTRHRARLSSSRMMSALLPLPIAASRSITAISPSGANRRASTRGSPASSTSVFPCRS